MSKALKKLASMVSDSPVGGTRTLGTQGTSLGAGECRSRFFLKFGSDWIGLDGMCYLLLDLCIVCAAKQRLSSMHNHSNRREAHGGL